MIVLDSLLIGGIRFVLSRIAEAVEAEMNDEGALREELLAAQMRLELGEIGEAQYREIEGALLKAISDLRARTLGEAPPAGPLTIAGAEVRLAGEEGDRESGPAGGHA